MAEKIAERLQWAVDTLSAASTDHLLEIGCGHGVAVSLVCERLTSGTITAIDRSEKMINLARKRNRQPFIGQSALSKGVIHKSETHLHRARTYYLFTTHADTLSIHIIKTKPP